MGLFDTVDLNMALYILFSVVLLGLVVGSFLNVVIYRLPVSMLRNWRQECVQYLEENPKGDDDSGETFNIAFPHSHCPQCKAPVKAWQNIPVLSYLLLHGKCASCKATISLRYPIIELVSAALTAFCIYQFGLTAAGGLALIFTWCLISLTMIDVDHQLLPDSITLPLLWLGLLANVGGIYTDLNSAVLGAVFGYGVLWSVFWLFKLATGKDGMGFGDFKLLAALGAWMGWQMLPLIVILSALVGAIIGIAGIIIQGRDKNIPIPFGPYLAVAGWVAFFWGEMLTNSYLQLLQP